MDDNNTFKVPSSPGSTLSFNSSTSGTSGTTNYDDMSCTMTLKYPQQQTPSDPESVEKELRFHVKNSPSQNFRYAVLPSKGTVQPGKRVEINILLSEKDKRTLFAEEGQSNLREVRQMMVNSLAVTWEKANTQIIKQNSLKSLASSSSLGNSSVTSMILTLRHPDTDPSSSKTYIAFKIITNQLRNYIIRPGHGILKPGSQMNIHITFIQKDKESIMESFQRDINDKIAILSQPVHDKSFAQRILKQASNYEAFELTDSKPLSVNETQKELFQSFITGWDVMAKSYPHTVSRNKIDILHTIDLNINPSDEYPAKRYHVTADAVLVSTNHREDLQRRARKTKRQVRVGRPRRQYMRVS